MRDLESWITVVVVAALCVLFPGVGDLLVASAGLALLVAAVSDRYRLRGVRLGVVGLWTAVLALAVLMLTDRFDVRYVWLYSGAELPAYLKLANVWGGDEGTTLLLAAVCASLLGPKPAVWRHPDVNAIVAAALALTAALSGPFVATPADWLARAAYQGMNAHLMKIWMLAHAPLVLAAYAWTLSLASPAIAALAGALTTWPNDALMRARRAWALLTAGIGFGMVWAFEDAMYGQVWHWDPVQTAVFAAWCLLGAHLHGIAGWRAGRPTWRWMPLAGALAAALTMVAMGVTRHEALASSHRYIGATSSSLYFSLAGLLVLFAGVAWMYGMHRVTSIPLRIGVAASALRLTQLAFAMLGLLAGGYLAWAFIASAKGLPRPEELKPFFATLTNWARGSELPALRTAFAQWDVDGYALARVLLFPLIGVGLIGGWFFMRRVATRLGWITLTLASLVCAVVWSDGGMLAREYSGTGVLSQQIVAVLPRIDASLIAGGYLAIGVFAWSINAARKAAARGYVLALGLVHLGAMLSLWGALLSTALNGYSQHVIDISNDNWRGEHHGYAFRVTTLDIDRTADGGRRDGKGSFRALAQVELRTPSQEVIGGETLYRDARAAVAGYAGPVRQICEILDYRYARYANQPGYVLHPFIDRGWGRDVQVWVSTSAAVAALEGGAQPEQAVVVLRVFPFASLLWIGLVITSGGALWLAFRSRKETS
ncbi:cytochrome C biogenesis protein CcmF [Aromatoleum petrolei]|uniref:Cytochrome C biogenesis protein CcmF n=2 Tax=Aromatoleum petrolei TaxID=76116 RepID=A0ABX1MQL5_9RHOO|nr:cytochrome c biogenesis protein CcsA [Aromatoleum petrolei]NMF88996.1 cytochrome C biogenesis protein CcmF [Aromatoleum petrolei]